MEYLSTDKILIIDLDAAQVEEEELDIVENETEEEEYDDG